MAINYLADLNSFRTAPKLTTLETQSLLKQLQIYINNSDWITVGIMHLMILTKALKSISINMQKSNLMV